MQAGFKFKILSQLSVRGASVNTLTAGRATSVSEAKAVGKVGSSSVKQHRFVDGEG